MKNILFSGVHGVGKEFYLNKVKNKIERFNIYSASDLIEKYQESADAGYKKVSNVKGNQEILIKAIKNISSSKNKNFILDGHLCIYNSENSVVRIPENFFIEAEIEGIILLQDSSEIIFDRIYKRDGNKIDIKFIEQMQEEEQKYAMELKQKYNIPYTVITHEYNEDRFVQILKSFGGEEIG